MNGTRNWCTLVDVHPEGQTAGSVDILRLTLQSELTGDELEHIAEKAGRRTFAMVSGHSTSRSLASELVKSNDGHEEIIKVYLKGRAGDKMIHEKNINQLKSEARNCLQKLREDISSKLDRDPGDSLQGQEIQVVLEKPNGLNPSPTTLYSSPPEVSKADTYINEDVESLRKTVRDLLVKLQEAERQHQSDRVAFEVTLSQCQREAEQSRVALQRAEDRVQQKEAEVGELQKCLLGVQEEHQALLVKVREGETALEELQIKNTDCQTERENFLVLIPRAANLEKEVAGLREKIHHLDDMLKSQQRKVRQMIEQLQNSKAVVQSKDSTIQELKEKIAYLEAENLEMHDRMEHLIEKQVSHGNFSTQTWAKTESLGSMRISKPPSPNKPMPLIRVVET
ncbi:tuftelin isoform X3 [Prionailurus bengalensis]|uniref:tuftelin isoform X3 n=1 Tax=Prionailurus bengalensis TaxID=37029 RepID=UPI001CA83923|nr:tuftelin isoform X3 [Prionailurus bengalensis]